MLESRRTLLTGLLGLSAISVTGCGFRLKGSFTVPFKTLYLDMDRNTPFAAMIIRQLKSSSDVVLLDSAEGAEAVLKILNHSQSRATAGYNAKGTASQYELTLSVTFRITTPQGVEYMPDSTVTLQRNMNYDSSTQYLSQANEEAKIYNEMYADAVGQMMRRVERSLRKAKQKQ